MSSKNNEERRRIIPGSKRILTPAEREGLELEINDPDVGAGQIKKNDPKMYQPDVENQQETSSTIRRYKRVLANHSPQPLSKGEKVEMEREFKEMQGWLQKRMITQKQTQLRAKDGFQFRKSVTAMAKDEMSTEFQRIAAKYKSFARQLFPDDPDLANLESIRPE